MAKPKVCVIFPRETADTVIAREDMDRLRKHFDLTGDVPDEVNDAVVEKLMKGVQGCITGWGTGLVPESAILAAPGLKIIAHSAGSVKGVVPLLAWKKGVVVTTAAESIAIGVAEFALGQMIGAMKRVWDFRVQMQKGVWHSPQVDKRILEFYHSTVGVVGAGFVGQHMLRLLRNMPCQILLYDPFVDEAKAREMGARKVTLEELMSQSDVVTLHAPSIPQTRHMINAAMLARMRDNTVLINTARGSLIDETALIAELKKGRIFACLDVTDPEPPVASSPLYTLHNVVLTPHIAGASTTNRLRQGKYAVDELERVLLKGEPPRFGIPEEALARMA